MKVALYQFKNLLLTRHGRSDDFVVAEAQLVLCLGAKHLLAGNDLLERIQCLCPVAEIVMCSTAGEIYGNKVFDDTVSISIIKFAHTHVVATSVHIENFENTFQAGLNLFNHFDQHQLASLLVISDGSMVNGSELVTGLNSDNKNNILITGGLAGDGGNFISTLVGLNEPPSPGVIVGIGLYGDKINVGHGSMGGWDMFGVEKVVTRSSGNVLFEIGDNNALDYYKRYLGKEAEGLPESALLFPLSIKLPDSEERVVRTILSIDEARGSMTFAGDIPEGSLVRFMRANFDKIIHASAIAASQAIPQDTTPTYALLVSCVGRKLILQARVDEEVEAVDDVFGQKTFLAGFYSYGEISPTVVNGNCQLHNQTMTITTFYEVE